MARHPAILGLIWGEFPAAAAPQCMLRLGHEAAMTLNDLLFRRSREHPSRVLSSIPQSTLATHALELVRISSGIEYRYL